MQQPPELNPDPMAGLVAELSKRLDSVERRLERMETHQREDAQALRQHIDDGLKTVNRRIDWLIGIHFGTFIALVGLLVGILLKLP